MAANPSMIYLQALIGTVQATYTGDLLLARDINGENFTGQTQRLQQNKTWTAELYATKPTMLLKLVYDYSRVAKGAERVLCDSILRVCPEISKYYQSLLVPSLFNELSKETDMYTMAHIKLNEAKGIANGPEIVRSVGGDIYLISKEIQKAKKAGKDLTNFTQKREYSKAYGSQKPFSNRRYYSTKPLKKVVLESSEVPSSRLGRIFHYGLLAATVGAGAAVEGLKRITSGSEAKGLLLLSPRNVERIAKRLSRMRGAALKVGQMMSFQDALFLPEQVQQILLQVQNNAHYMPPGQLERVMVASLGPEWRRFFASFEDVPMAAALIGQVHEAVTREGHTQVVVKVQYPGVADSIDLDLNNILLLLTALQMLPKGLFLEKSIASARVELKWECDYLREAQNIVRFGELLRDDPVFRVPRVFHNLSGEHVITMERMRGVEIAKGQWDQETRDWIANHIMRLCLTEIIKFRFMQTDPNWANFLYNEKNKTIELLDFGASIEYSESFVQRYANLLRAAAKGDRQGVEKYSKDLGYLTGMESPTMVSAHVDLILALGEPFSPEYNKGAPYDFSKQTVTDRVRGRIGTMLNERLLPPPQETYSLHRKFSGVFLLCARLGAKVECEKLFGDIFGFEEK